MSILRPLAVLALVLAACGKSDPIPPPPPALPTHPVTAPKPPPPPPAEVPKDFASKIEAAWPDLETRGNKMLAHFDAAVTAKNTNDRIKLKAEVEAFEAIWDQVSEEWAGLTDQVNDMSDRQAKVCWEYLSPKERVYKGWLGKAKAIKELSTN